MEPRPAITIGVLAHAEPQRLHGTLASLRAHAPGATVLLLLDGPDDPTSKALA